MIGRYLALGVIILVLAASASAGPPGSVPPGPPPPPDFLASPPGANICTTAVGWCHLPSLAAPHGVDCVCLTADNAWWVRGVTRFFPNTVPPSPYLHPHTGAPTTIR